MKGTKVRRTIVMSSVLTAVGLAIASCGAGEFVEKQTADAWSVTYRITVEGGEINALEEVTYLEAPSRGEESVETDRGTAATVNDPDAAHMATWEETAVVTAQSEAGVSATPREGATATCQVLLDGEKEIAAETGRPGTRVDCRVSTPAFDKK